MLIITYREDLFANIEFATLLMPRELSQDARSLLSALLEKNPALRLGSGRGDSSEIKNHSFFRGIDWDLVF